MQLLRAGPSLAVLVALLLAGCGSGAEREAGEPEPGSQVAIEVQNNLVPPTSLTVWSHADTGSRQLLGTVSPRSERTFEVSLARVGRRLQLVAETTDGGKLFSRAFVVSRDAIVVEWDLNLNSVTVR